jgi:hypothetical protein
MPERWPQGGAGGPRPGRTTCASVLGRLRCAQQWATKPTTRGAMAEFISRACWMRDIYDDTPLTMLTIPGTHNSAASGGPWGSGKRYQCC